MFEVAVEPAGGAKAFAAAGVGVLLVDCTRGVSGCRVGVFGCIDPEDFMLELGSTRLSGLPGGEDAAAFSAAFAETEAPMDHTK